MANGWIKLHRELIDKPIWKCSLPEQKAVLITILCLANHKEKEWVWQGEKYTCLPGQFITSLNSLAESAGVSIRSVRTALKNFEAIYGFLTNTSTNKNRLITIVNWALYQYDDEISTSTSTDDRQASDKQATTNNNEKNYKNDKKYNYIELDKDIDKDKNKRFTPPKLEEVKAYCKERNNNIDPETFIDYYTSNGWVVGKNKMKDWKATVRTWEKRHNTDKPKSMYKALGE